MLPSVSLVIPTYNSGSDLADVLASVAAQTTAPIEVLVVDGGSRDDTLDILRRHPVHIVAPGGYLGLAQARNLGWRKARGEIILYLDSDALAAPDLVQVIVREYVDERVAGVGGQGIETSREGVSDRWRRLHGSQTFGSERLRPAPMLFGLCSSYRRRALEAIGGFDETFLTNGEDLDIGLRLRRAGWDLVYTPHARVRHLRTDTLRSLLQMQYRYFYWGALVQAKNQLEPFPALSHKARRELRRQIVQDLFEQRSLPLAVVEMLVYRHRKAGLRDARRNLGRGRP